MNSVLLESAIRARLVQSAAVEGVAVQGAWSTVAPEGVQFTNGSQPYIVFNLQTGLVDDTFDYNAFDATYRVSIFDHISNGTTNAAALYDAVIGNGTPTTAPTKGLHRWEPTVAGMGLSQMAVVRFGYGHTGDTLMYWADFEVQAREA